MNGIERTREQWREIRRLEADLRRKGGEAVFISLMDGGGNVIRVVDADPFTAARSIVSGTHRLATREEIENWVGEQKAAETAIRAAELSRDNKAFVLPRNAA